MFDSTQSVFKTYQRTSPLLPRRNGFDSQLDKHNQTKSSHHTFVLSLGIIGFMIGSAVVVNLGKSNPTSTLAAQNSSPVVDAIPLAMNTQSAGQVLGVQDGQCVIGWANANKTVSTDEFGYISYNQLDANKPDGAIIKVFDLDQSFNNTSNFDLTTANLTDVDLLIVADGTDYRVRSNNAVPTQTQLDAVKSAYNNGLNIWTTSDNGGWSVASASYASALTLPLVNHLGVGIVYRDTFPIVTETKGKTGGTTYPLLNGWNWTTIGTANRTPGIITYSNPVVCASKLNFTGGSTCLLAYVSPTTNNGFLLVDTNRGNISRQMIASDLVWNTIADCSAIPQVTPSSTPTPPLSITPTELCDICQHQIDVFWGPTLQTLSDGSRYTYPNKRLIASFADKHYTGTTSQNPTCLGTTQGVNDFQITVPTGICERPVENGLLKSSIDRTRVYTDGYARAVIRNASSFCTFEVGVASYAASWLTQSPWLVEELNTQTLFDSKTQTLSPGQTVELLVKMPTVQNTDACYNLPE